MRGSVVVTARKCVTCKRCEIECAIAHSQSGDLYEVVEEYAKMRRRVRVAETEKGPKVFICRHCKKPKCVEACPTGALQKQEDGIVSYEAGLCDDCYACVEACPFNAVWRDPQGGIVKCDLCVSRLDRDELPACVYACHTSALTFREARLKEEVKK